MEGGEGGNTGQVAKDRGCTNLCHGVVQVCVFMDGLGGEASSSGPGLIPVQKEKLAGPGNLLCLDGGESGSLSFNAVLTNPSCCYPGTVA